MQIVIQALIEVLKWVTNCEQHEPQTYKEALLHYLSCGLRLFVFAMGTWVILAAVLRLAGA